MFTPNPCPKCHVLPFEHCKGWWLCHCPGSSSVLSQSLRGYLGLPARELVWIQCCSLESMTVKHLRLVRFKGIYEVLCWELSWPLCLSEAALVSSLAVLHLGEHRHAAPPRAPDVPGHACAQREEAACGAGGAGGTGPCAQCQAPGLVAPTVPLLSKGLVLSWSCRTLNLAGWREFLGTRKSYFYFWNKFCSLLASGWSCWASLYVYNFWSVMSRAECKAETICKHTFM